MGDFALLLTSRVGTYIGSIFSIVEKQWRESESTVRIIPEQERGCPLELRQKFIGDGQTREGRQTGASPSQDSD